MQYHTKIVGEKFRPAQDRELLDAAKNEVSNGGNQEFKLEREPDNKYDSNAVKVLLPIAFYPETEEPLPVDIIDSSEFVFVGYIPKTDNTPIAQALDRGAAVTAIMNFPGLLEVTVREP